MTSSRTAEREPAIFSHPTKVLVETAALLIVVGVLAVVVGADRHLGIDDSWWRWMRDGRTAGFTDVSKGLNVFGDFFVQLVIRFGVAAVLVVRSWWRRLGAWAFVALLSTPIGDFVKALVDRPRPAHGLVHAAGAAFPSGHAVAAAVTALGIVLAFTVPGRIRVLGFVIAVVYVVVMAWSRTELGVHWLTDVVAGAGLGAALTLGSFATADLVAGRRAAPVETARGAQQ
jgi:membrane-associated phospholipid phosphatase